MRACNPRGPLVIYVCKLFPKADVSAFDAYGRVMSGTVKPGDKASRLCVCLLDDGDQCLIDAALAGAPRRLGTLPPHGRDQAELPCTAWTDASSFRWWHSRMARACCC